MLVHGLLTAANKRGKAAASVRCRGSSSSSGCMCRLTRGNSWSTRASWGSSSHRATKPFKADMRTCRTARFACHTQSACQTMVGAAGSREHAAGIRADMCCCLNMHNPLPAELAVHKRWPPLMVIHCMAVPICPFAQLTRSANSSATAHLLMRLLTCTSSSVSSSDSSGSSLSTVAAGPSTRASAGSCSAAAIRTYSHASRAALCCAV